MQIQIISFVWEVYKIKNYHESDNTLNPGSPQRSRYESKFALSVRNRESNQGIQVPDQKN